MLSEKAKEAKREYQRAWRKKNKERLRDYQRTWRKNNPEKVKQNEINMWERKAKEMQQ